MDSVYLELVGTLSDVSVPQLRDVQLTTIQSGSHPLSAVETRTVPHLCIPTGARKNALC